MLFVRRSAAEFHSEDTGRWPAAGQAIAEGRLDDPVSPIPVTAQRARRRGLFR